MGQGTVLERLAVLETDMKVVKTDVSTIKADVKTLVAASVIARAIPWAGVIALFLALVK